MEYIHGILKNDYANNSRNIILELFTMCNNKSKMLHSNRNKLFLRFYHKNVIDHFENPRNIGLFDKSKKSVGTSLVGAPACGDVMKLQIEVDKTGKIIDAKFKTFGCGSAIG